MLVAGGEWPPFRALPTSSPSLPSITSATLPSPPSPISSLTLRSLHNLLKGNHRIPRVVHTVSQLSKISTKVIGITIRIVIDFC